MHIEGRVGFTALGCQWSGSALPVFLSDPASEWGPRCLNRGALLLPSLLNELLRAVARILAPCLDEVRSIARSMPRDELFRPVHVRYDNPPGARYPPFPQRLSQRWTRRH